MTKKGKKPHYFRKN